MTPFTLTPEQEKHSMSGGKKKKTLAPATIGGAYTFCFNPTGIGMLLTVKCVDGTELDLTEDF